MDTTSTLALRIDGNGVLHGARQTTGALDSIGHSTTKVEGKLKAFGTNAAFAFSSLASSGARDITSVLRSLTSLGFAFGATAGAIALVSTSIVDGLVGAFQEAQEESKRMTDALLADARRLSEFTKQALEVRLAALEREKAAINARINQQGGAVGGSLDLDAMFGGGPTVGKKDLQRFVQLEQLIRETSRALKDATEAQGKFNAEASDKATRELAEAFRRTTEEAERFGTEIMPAVLRDMARSADEAEAFRKAFADPLTGTFGTSTQDAIQMAIEGVRETVKKLEDAEAQAKRTKEALLGMAAGAGAGLLNRVAPGMGGILSGGFSGFQAAGPWGAAAGATMGLVDALFGVADAAKRTRDQMRQLRQTLDDIRFEMSGNDDLTAALRQNARMFDDLRRSVKGQTSDLGAYKRQLDEINQLEKDRADFLTKEASALAEVQRIEKLNAEIRTVEDRIANLANTITGLKDFRNALTISGASGLSPTDRLSSARTQYEDILRVAKGGVKIPGLDGASDIMFSQAEMSEAAGRLPAAAQALLELSRLVNASGEGFQSDFLKILQDTAGVITTFQDLKTVEEAMLEQLRLIAGHTDPEKADRPPGRRGPGGGLEDDPWLAVMSSGFSQTIERLDALAEAIDNNASQTRRAVTALT